MDKQQPGPSKKPGKSDNQPEKSTSGTVGYKYMTVGKWKQGPSQKRINLAPPGNTTGKPKVSASKGKQDKKDSRSEKRIVLTPPESKKQKPEQSEKRIILTPPEIKAEQKQTVTRVVLSPKSSLVEPKKESEVTRVVLTPPDNPKYATVVLTPEQEGQKYATVVLTPEQEAQKYATVVLTPSHSHGITPETKKSKPSVDHSGKVDDNTLVQKIMSLLSQGNSRETYLNQLKAFGIPDQKRLLRFLLDKDTQIFDFGGLMRKYYSFVLRNYALINMQDNYREPYNFLTCFAGLDVSKIGSKEEEQEKEMDKKLKQREEKQEDLRYVSIDEEHFLYLKQLANEQPTTIPLTVLKGLVQQAMPVLMDTYRTYARTFGNSHECTKLACEQYVRMKTRINLYNKMECLPSSQR